MTEAFPLRISAMFREGWTGYIRNVGPLTVGALATFATYGVFRLLADQALDDGQEIASVVLDLVGLVLAGTVSVPWYAYAINAARARPIDLGGPWREGSLFSAQFVCAFWFWAAVMLGLRYLFGLPSILAFLFYGFHGYVVADRAAKGGLRALGTSVRLGHKRRMALFAILTLFILFNFVSALPLGYGASPLSIAVSVAAFSATASVTLVSGACLYDALTARLDEQ